QLGPGPRFEDEACRTVEGACDHELALGLSLRRRLVLHGISSLSLPATIGLFPSFQFLDDLVQLVEACGPELAIALDPCRLLLQWARPEFGGPPAAAVRCGEEPRLLQDADVLLHAREGHVEFIGKVRDGGVGTRELLQNAASRNVRERGE